MNPMTIPFSNLYEEFMNPFDEPVKDISQKSKAVDNKEDELQKIIDDVAKDLENKPPNLKVSDIPSQPQVVNALIQGQGSKSTSTPSTHIQGEHSNPQVNHEIPIQEENPILNEEPNPSFEWENVNINDDSDAQSEFEDVNVELDPSYDPNYPLLIKWTRDHPKTQVIIDASS